jgi:hypothetical protein
MAAQFQGGPGGAVGREPADDQLGGLETDLDPLPGPVARPSLARAATE